MPWQRGPAQVPGDLYLDPSLPDTDRVRVSTPGWAAEATHVWTGLGWSRLLTTPVRLVPGAVEQHGEGAATVVPLPRLGA